MPLGTVKMRMVGRPRPSARVDWRCQMGDDMGDEQRPREPIEYVLGVLSDEERARFEERLERDPISAGVGRGDRSPWSPRCRSLTGDSWQPARAAPVVPARQRSRFRGRRRARNGSPRSMSATSSRPRSAIPSGWRLPAIAAGAPGDGRGRGRDRFGALAAATVRPSSLDRREQRPAARRAGRPRSRRRGTGRRRRRRRTRASPSRSPSMPADPPGRYYEVWLMKRQGQAGLTRRIQGGRGRPASDRCPACRSTRRLRLIDVSLERADGTPGTPPSRSSAARPSGFEAPSSR